MQSFFWGCIFLLFRHPETCSLPCLRRIQARSAAFVPQSNLAFAFWRRGTARGGRGQNTPTLRSLVMSSEAQRSRNIRALAPHSIITSLLSPRAPFPPHNFHKRKTGSAPRLFTKPAQISPRNAGLTVFLLIFRLFSYLIYI